MKEKLPIAILLLFQLTITRTANAQSYSEVRDAIIIEENRVTIKEHESANSIVFTFFSADCPLSRKYTKTMREISQSNTDITFYLVFSGSQKKKKIEKFLSTYDLKIPVLLDADLRLARALMASVTPEVFLLSRGKVVYSGAIDDWVIKLGSTKAEPQNHYLADAISAVRIGKVVEIEKTKAIGCFIE